MQVDRRLLTLLQALALLAAIAVAGYLTWMKAQNQIPPCSARGRGRVPGAPAAVPAQSATRLRGGGAPASATLPA